VGFLTTLFGAESEPLGKRIARGLGDHWREFRTDPRGYVRFLLGGSESDGRRQRIIFISSLLYVAVVAAILSLDRMKSQRPVALPSPMIARAPVTLIEPLPPLPLHAPRQKERAGGGGGGGRKESRPPSFGRLPKAELKPPIVAPSPHLPEITRPSLPVLPTIMAQPELLPKLDLSLPLGDPTSHSSIPSSGPGSGGGIGTGQGGGVGPGRGVGYGPGEGWNTGGGAPRLGGGDIASRPIITFKPRPEWTEEARRNRIQGVVVLSATFGADGKIKHVRVIRGLGYGLDEKAIEAALRIRFVPARDARGNPVDWRGTIYVEFHLL
jgi:TonB family protein